MERGDVIVPAREDVADGFVVHGNKYGQSVSDDLISVSRRINKLCLEVGLEVALQFVTIHLRRQQSPVSKDGFKLMRHGCIYFRRQKKRFCGNSLTLIRSPQ